MTPESFTFRLCGQDVSVLFSDPGNWQTTGMGRSNSLRGEIELSTNLTDSTRDSTFLHETIHLLMDIGGYHTESSNEQLVNHLANGLLAWMRDNPELVKGITGQKEQTGMRSPGFAEGAKAMLDQIKACGCGYCIAGHFHGNRGDRGPCGPNCDNGTTCQCFQTRNARRTVQRLKIVDVVVDGFGDEVS
jgi:hypothetical protein